MKLLESLALSSRGWCEVADTPEEEFGPDLSRQDGEVKGRKHPRDCEVPARGFGPAPQQSQCPCGGCWPPLLAIDPSRTRALGPGPPPQDWLFAELQQLALVPANGKRLISSPLPLHPHRHSVPCGTHARTLPWDEGLGCRG